MRLLLCVIVAAAAALYLPDIEFEETRYKYVDTANGILPYSKGYCMLGVTTNNSYVAFTGINGKPIPCFGYLDLTKAEAKARGGI